MAQERVVAVLSGDLVKSKGLEDKRQKAMGGLLRAVEKARAHLKTMDCRLLFSGFYRGDAFQCGLSESKFALWTAFFLRTELITLRGNGLRADVRIGLGLGTVSDWNEDNISASDGEAFQLSGQALDSLKSGKEKYRRMHILSPWSDCNELLSVTAALIDALIQKWTPAQAQAISLFLSDKAQEEISRSLGISQPAVQTRLERAGHFAVKETLHLFSHVIERHMIKPDGCNSDI